MRHFVGGEEDVGHFEETVAKEVGEGVVFLLEEENACVRDACRGRVSERMPLQGVSRKCLRVSGMIVTFFSPSPRRKDSNLGVVMSAISSLYVA